MADDQQIAEMEMRSSSLEAEYKRMFPGRNFIIPVDGATTGDAESLRKRIQRLEANIDLMTLTRSIITRHQKQKSETEKFRRRWAQVQADNNSVFRTAVGRVCDRFNTRGRP